MVGMAENLGLNVEEETENSKAVAAQDAFDSEDAPDALFVPTEKNMKQLPPRKRMWMERP
jgi:hypothetical protein